MKSCFKCGAVKALSEFYGPWINKPLNSQYDGYCKPCRRIYNRQYTAERKARNIKIPKVKECRCCKTRKNSKVFPRDARSHDGLFPYCRMCKAEIQRMKTFRGSRKTFIYPESKKCCRCGDSFGPENFRRRNGSCDGLESACKDCHRISEKATRDKRVMARVEGPKRCTDCCESLDSSDFWSDKTKSDGMKSYCKDCSRERNRDWREKKRAAKMARLM